MPKPDTRKLVCPACSHENEVERVYCHNCGEKLDRSLLPKVEQVMEETVLVEDQKRVQKLMNPNRKAWFQHLRTFSLIIIFSAVVAAVFLICQAPDHVPLEKTDRIADQDVGDLWAAMIASRTPVSVTVKEFDVNYYLKKSIKSTESLPGLKFKRAFFSFAPGSTTVSAQRDVWGQPLFTSVTFKPVVANGKWSAQITGMNIGRLRVHPSIGFIGNLTSGGLAKAFEKELKQLDRFASIEPGTRTITFVTKPAQ